MQELLRLQQAAKLLGVSYPTLKQWIYSGKVGSARTPGGHHRIPRSEIERLTGRGRGAGLLEARPARLDGISGRNKLLGIITEVKSEGLLAQVTIDVGGQAITSIITRGACEELGLKVGDRAFALIKATEVMVIRG
ncbi:MAG: helix-turn-helix transcriptional regulator [Acidobacteria bacterium]|nr:helix-turn-helix transcriptional regulator [Acidobacteriota bacterium]